MAPDVDELLERLAAPPEAPLRRQLARGVRRALGASPGELACYAEPPGDPGWFGPGSVIWEVHADLPAMLIGGLSALMLQSLHPLAMAGVAAHSRFREDPRGRLQRTARFIAGTTFGSSAFAEEVAAEVRRRHARVRGHAPDGRFYAAEDPALLRFVHTCEVWSFLRSYQRYAPRPLLFAEKDRYLAEVPRLGEVLGASELPDSVAAVRAYLRAIRPELAMTAEAKETLGFLLDPPTGGLGERAGYEILTAAAIDLLPPFARRLLGLSPLHGGGAPVVRPAARAFAAALRWSVGPSAVRTVAAARVGASALGTLECQVDG